MIASCDDTATRGYKQAAGALRRCLHVKQQRFDFIVVVGFDILSVARKYEAGKADLTVYPA